MRECDRIFVNAFILFADDKIEIEGEYVDCDEGVIDVDISILKNQPSAMILNIVR